MKEELAGLAQPRWTCQLFFHAISRNGQLKSANSADLGDSNPFRRNGYRGSRLPMHGFLTQKSPSSQRKAFFFAPFASFA
jgi:hypothetical protein